MFLPQVMFAAALAIQPEAGLRLLNPHEVAVDAIVRCGNRASVVSLDARGVADVAAAALCESPQVDSPQELVAFETLDGEQRLLANAECPAPALSIPLFGCRLGTATVSAPALQDATFTWTVEGATIVSGQGTPIVKLALSSEPFVSVTARIATPSCTHAASGIIVLREPLSFELTAPASVDAGKSITVDWSYAAGGEPASQVLKGDALPEPVVLPAAQRSYTFTPTLSGTNTLELHASYAPSIPLAPRGGRRRSAGSTLATASQCTDARATRQFEVAGACDSSKPRIQAASQVEAGGVLTATVPLTRTETALWRVENGTIISGEKSGTVQVLVSEAAGENVSLKVRITRGSNCIVESTSTAAIQPRAACPGEAPTATVTLLSRACKTAMVQAVFTGTPPFRGFWPDGTPLLTSEKMITREVSFPGVYTIGNFSDSRCRGKVTSTAEIKSFAPSAVLTSADSCTGTTVTAKLTGKPPFKGRFYPGDWFDTNQTTLTMKMPTGWFWSRIDHLTDGWCPEGGQGVSSNEVQLATRRHGRMDPDDLVCVAEEPAYVGVFFVDRMPPYTVKWSDGVVSIPTAAPQYYSASRSVTTKKWDDELRIVEAFDGQCEVIIDDPVVKVSYRPKPRIDTNDAVVCTDQTEKVLLKPATLHPDTKLVWSGKNGVEIVGSDAQGVMVKNVAPGWTSRLRVTATFPDGSCGDAWSDEITLFGATKAVASDLKVLPTTIKPGEKATITFNRTGTLEHFSLSATEAARSSDVRGGICGGDGCRFDYVDTHGAGTVTLQLQYGGPCNHSNPPLQVTLKIAP